MGFFRLIIISVMFLLSACASPSVDVTQSNNNISREEIRHDRDTCPINRWEISEYLDELQEDAKSDGLMSGLADGTFGASLVQMANEGGAEAEAQLFAENVRRQFQEIDRKVRVGVGSARIPRSSLTEFAKERLLAEMAAELRAKGQISEGLAINTNGSQSALSSSQRTGVTEQLKTRSANILLGATEIASFESWNGDEFQTASVVAWSPGLELNVRATFLGCAESFSAVRSNLSIDSLYKDNVGLPQGSRVLIDARGRIIFLGTGVYPVTNSQSQIALSQSLSEKLAIRNLLTGMLGPIYQESSMQMQSSFREEGSAHMALQVTAGVHSILEGVRLPGIKILKEGIVEDPISRAPYFITLAAYTPNGEQRNREAFETFLKTRFAKGIKLLETPPTYLDGMLNYWGR